MLNNESVPEPKQHRILARKTPRWLGALVIAYGILVAGATTDVSGAIVFVESSKATGAISGTITDASSSAPVSGITVAVYSSGGAFVTSVLSDGAGQYTVSGLADGSYFLQTFAASGYFVSELYNNIPCATSCVVTNGTPVVVTSGNTQGGVDFSLTPVGAINGTVTDQNGAAMGGAFVAAFSDAGTLVTVAVTNGLGGYTVAGLSAGNYFVRTVTTLGLDEVWNNVPCEGTCDVTTGSPVPVTTGATQGGINFSLVVGGSITGTVRDATSGNPIDGVVVQAYSANGALVSSGITSGFGGYVIPNLQGGSYYVRTLVSLGSSYGDEIFSGLPCALNCDATAGTPVTVTFGSGLPGVDLNLTHTPSQVRLVYAVPQGRPVREDHLAAIQTAALNLRAWYKDQAGGTTFSIFDIQPEICVLPGTEAYYVTGPADKATADVNSCAQVGPASSKWAWMMFTDVNFACDESALAIGQPGFAHFGREVLEGLIGAPFTDGCGASQPGGATNGYVGLVGHELGHAFGLAHPPGCDTNDPGCDTAALMGFGAPNFPNTYLRPDNVVTLLGGPYFRVETLIANGTFDAGLTGWSQFATPDNSYIDASVSAGRLNFYRVPPPPGQSNSAVVLQATGSPVAAGKSVTAQFSLGNSSSARKRVSVLIHDNSFADLTVCTFWLAPNTAVRPFLMRARTTQAWTDATISFYAATEGSAGGAYLVDDVLMDTDEGQLVRGNDCFDPEAPWPVSSIDGPDLVVNGGFSNGAAIAPWQTFGMISGQVSAGVFEFVRPAGQPAGVILQPTGQPMPIDAVLTARFDLGNSSLIRKRVTVILHDLDFSDLLACTFWIPPGQPLSPYVMRMFTTKAWTNTTISFYGATEGLDQWTQLDNVTLRQTPSASNVGTDCFEPDGIIGSATQPPPPMSEAPLVMQAALQPFAPVARVDGSIRSTRATPAGRPSRGPQTARPPRRAAGPGRR